jgi:hypothetical protein
MASGGLPVERLRQYLRQLPPGARALLVTRLEQATVSGEDFPGGDLVLAELRNAARDCDVAAPAADANRRRR